VDRTRAGRASSDDMFVKICGIADAAALEAAVGAGADAVGFVFAPSPRQVTAARAAVLCRGLPTGIVRVAVLRDPTPGQWSTVMERFGPDWVQCERSDLERFELPRGVRALPVYRTDRGAPDTAGTLPARVLVEGPASGSGQRADWEAAAALARSTEVVLAGGLTAANVAQAIAAVRPWGVDVSSGVERARGRKDPALITQFVLRVRELESTVDPAH
jgi:phosphoribosylanthranilate isomerase